MKGKHVKNCASGVVVTASVTVKIGLRNLAMPVKFDIANLYIKVPSCSNSPLDVLNILYFHQPVCCVLVT